MAFVRASLMQLLVRHGLQWFGGVIRALRRLWLEVTGAIFLGLALFGVPAAIREWRVYQQEGDSLFRLAVTIFFIAMMTGFGVYSFLKWRRLR